MGIQYTIMGKLDQNSEDGFDHYGDTGHHYVDTYPHCGGGMSPRWGHGTTMEIHDPVLGRRDLTRGIHVTTLKEGFTTMGMHDLALEEGCPHYGDITPLWG